MLPSRGLARHPAAGLRSSLPSRTKPTRIIATRQFSQATSPQSVRSNHGLARTSRLLQGRTALPLTALTHGSPRLIAGAAGTAWTASAGVFAQRSGATRNLSLWPFSSPKQPTPTSAAETTVPSSSSSSSSTSPSSAAETEFSAPAPPAASTVTPTPGSEATNYASSSSSPETANYADLGRISDDFLGTASDTPSYLDMPVHIGYFNELGLDFGHWTTAGIAWIFEHVHVYSGLPWLGSLVAMAVLFRAVLFYPTLVGSKHQARLQLLSANSTYAALQKRSIEAQYRQKNMHEVMLVKAKMRNMRKAAGIQQWKTAAGMAAVPFSFGMFRIVRAMADIPVPGLDTAGLFWFTDLTVPDPFYILPLASAGLAVVLFKAMQRHNLTINPMQQMMSKIMTRVMPPLILVGSIWLPAGLQVFFISLSLTSLLQAVVTNNRTVRRWADLPPLPDTPIPVTPYLPSSLTSTAGSSVQYQSPTSPSLRSSVKDGMASMSKTVKEATGSTDEATRWKKAQRYEERRAEEEKQKAEKRMEDVRRRRTGR
ncbi:hypothetical protein F4777DRAFT_557882 [Nemania sp. FL0916]|nr:hypothetical protein F4777DRAFT_557882 [Nemania sp. FL0916]